MGTGKILAVDMDEERGGLLSFEGRRSGERADWLGDLDSAEGIAEKKGRSEVAISLPGKRTYVESFALPFDEPGKVRDVVEAGMKEKLPESGWELVSLVYAGEVGSFHRFIAMATSSGVMLQSREKGSGYGDVKVIVPESFGAFRAWLDWEPDASGCSGLYYRREGGGGLLIRSKGFFRDVRWIPGRGDRANGALLQVLAEYEKECDEPVESLAVPIGDLTEEDCLQMERGTGLPVRKISPAHGAVSMKHAGAGGFPLVPWGIARIAVHGASAMKGLMMLNFLGGASWREGLKSLRSAAFICIAALVLLLAGEGVRISLLKKEAFRLNEMIREEANKKIPTIPFKRDIRSFGRLVRRRIASFGEGYERKSSLNRLIQKLTTEAGPEQRLRIENVRLRGKTMELTGWTDKLERVHAFSRRLSGVKYFRNIRTKSVSQEKEGKALRFFLEMEVL